MTARTAETGRAVQRRIVALLLSAGLVVLAAPSIARAANITGTWDVTGSVAADQTWTFTSGTGVLAGEGGGKSFYTWPMAGTITGSSVYVITKYRETTYTAYFKGTVSPDGNTMTGTWSTDPAPTSGDSDWKAVRRGSTPGGGTGGKRATGTRVSCNRGPLPTDDFQCTVEVGDGPPGTPTNPTGTVTFTSTRGSFRFGTQCLLKPTPLSGGVSSCTVTWIPPAGGLEAGNQPDLVAHYPGDSTHAPSQGTTQPKIAIGYTVPSVATPAACSSAAGDAESIAKKQARKASSASRRAQAHAALNTFHYDAAQKNWGDWAYYNAVTCKNAAGTGLGYLFQGAGVGLPVVYNGALLFDVEPVTRVMGTTWGNNVVILPTSYIVYKAGENMVETAEKSQKDPPDPRFKAYAKIKRSPRITIRPGGGLSRSAAGALGRYLTAQLAAAATAKALGATIDKAGGAQKGRSPRWQGRQIRLALRYAKRFVGQLASLPGLRAKAARAAARAPQFNRAPSVRAVRRGQAKLRRGGFKKGLAARLRILGFDGRELRALRRAAGSAKLDGDLRPIRMLTERRVSDAYRMLASYFRIWAASPQVIAASRLR
ncbi:MAG: Ig-like domain-containing protein [Solirubrobacteraceae bacterium]